MVRRTMKLILMVLCLLNGISNISTMNAEQRLKLISKIAQNAIKKDSIFFDSDELWLIGMLSDTTTSEKNLKAEIEEVKRDYPDYAQFLEKAIDFC